jgi:hypothetical protein
VQLHIKLVLPKSASLRNPTERRSNAATMGQSHDRYYASIRWIFEKSPFLGNDAILANEKSLDLSSANNNHLNQ